VVMKMDGKAGGMKEINYEWILKYYSD
jgi:hypothetical protein